AILIYIVLLFIVIIVLVVNMLNSEAKKEQHIKQAKDIYKEYEAQRVINEITKKCDKELETIRLEMTKQRVTMEHIGTPVAQAIVEEQPKPINEDFPEFKQMDDDIVPSQNGDSRFYMLTQIDKQYENYVSPEYNTTISLKEFCEEFRNFSCNKLKLYYDITDIRRFVAGLAVTKLIILQGMSGTGKTSLAYAFGEFLKNKTVVVPIQPMWKERTDLIGYYNEFTKKFNETTLLYKMYEANNNRDIYCTVLDEMNIARVEYYFAEFLSLLELPNPEGRNLDVVSDVWENDPKLLNQGKLRLPINMWFVGTANNDDSTFAISDKVYDRAMVLNLDKKAEVFEAPETEPCQISVDHLHDLIRRAQKEFNISDRNLRRLKKLDKYMIDTFHITFGNRIMKQIRAYVPVVVACGGTELEALDDILSRKILRKLESKNPVYVRAQAEGLCNYLDDLFGIDKMELCKETIRTIEQNV
ncbi:MAG: AAA family ATPase, partial [Acholeplasmatales bacterium]|nr:AAA family ATPase [Acholeplasmatales bacterium]